MGHYTADQWDEYMRQNFGTVGEAERWRNANNVFVDGLPPPEYTGPLSTGGFAGELPPSAAAQGTPNVEDDETTPQGALPSAGYDESGVPTQQQWTQDTRSLNAGLIAAQKRAEANRTKNYDEETATLKARRYGPSLSEQLFALSAAIGKPTYRRSFGEILGNVAPALADMQRANREAAQAREDAASELRRKYLLEGSGNELANIDRRIKAQALWAPLMKPKPVRTGFNPLTGQLVNMDTNEPIEAPAPAVGTVKTFNGRNFQFVGGDQYNKNNWKEVR